MNRKIETIIFDLDGTLIDSLEDIADCANTVLRDYGLTVHPKEDYRFYVGDGLTTLVHRIAPVGTPESLLADLRDGFVRTYEDNWHRATKPYPGIDEMLIAIQKKNCKLAILSNKPDAFTKLCADHFFPHISFLEVWGQKAGLAKKPAPDAALLIARKCGSAPQHCVFVGDTSVDMRTGRAASMSAVGVSWGFREVAELEAAGADTIITKPEQLIAYVFATS
jgi:phosphoglycolate phosphatase